MNITKFFNWLRVSPSSEEIFDVAREHNSIIFEKQVKESMENWGVSKGYLFS